MNKKILLIGEPMGLFIAQTEGELDTVDGYSFAIAGAEYNVAVGMSRLGHHVDYITKLGNDPFGKRIVRGLRQNGIGDAGVTWSHTNPTGFMLKSKVSSGDPRVFYFRKGSAASTLDVRDVDLIDISAYSHLHMTGILPAISENCFAASRRLMQRAQEIGLYVSFDPNLRPTLWSSQERMVEAINELAKLSDLVLPGISEGEILTGKKDPREIAQFYMDMGVKAAVIKCGAQGAYARWRDGDVMVPGFVVERVVDTVGAGDGFAVGMVSALMEGMPIAEAVRRGNAIGAVQVMCTGDNEGLPTREQLTAFMDRGTANASI
ncbi:MAG: sugar kinase [Angelakisella sp.]